jgi:hypothetical protein
MHAKDGFGPSVANFPLPMSVLLPAAVLPLDLSLRQHAICATPLDTSVSVVLQTLLPPDVFVVQQFVRPWMCLFFSSLCCP